MIKLVNIKKIYHADKVPVTALSGVDLSVKEGEFVSIIGRSGSGKSTLMHIIGCLDTPTSGEYILNGISVRGMDSDRMARLRRDTIGFVFQKFHLMPNMDAVANVALPLALAGVDRKEREARAIEALEKVGLSDRAHHRPGEMSGGQQQRVAIARAMIAKPKILLADEPTGNLDAACARDILSKISDIHKNGRTVILITHDDMTAMRADRCIKIADGAIVDDRKLN